MLRPGKIIIIENSELASGHKIQYGFVKAKDMNEDVLFNKLSFFHTPFEDLKVDDRVQVSIKYTDQGPFAESLILFKPHLQKETPLPPESCL